MSDIKMNSVAIGGKYYDVPDVVLARIAELEDDVQAAAWILEWMVAEKYRKPDVPALIQKARREVKAREARIAELEAKLEFSEKERIGLARERNELLERERKAALKETGE